jgi:hypothetical protein
MARKVKTIKVARIWGDKDWTVRFGWLHPGRGHPKGVPRLFKVLGEKLPFDSLPKVDGHLRDSGIGPQQRCFDANRFTVTMSALPSATSDGGER